MKKTQNEYVSECVNSLEMKRLFPDQNERARICTQKYITTRATEWTKSLFDGADICPGCSGPMSYDDNNNSYCSTCDNNGPRGDTNEVSQVF